MPEDVRNAATGPSEPTRRSRTTPDEDKTVHAPGDPEWEQTGEHASETDARHEGEGGGALGTDRAGMSDRGIKDPALGEGPTDNNAGGG